MSLLNLPLELLPAILNEIVKPHHLALCCLVNRIWFSFAIPQLYERIYIYAWHKQGKTKVAKLFRTLSENPEFARWVKKLELRDFPPVAYSSESYQSMSENCLLGLAQCTSLRSCTWTRDQTLSTEILEVLGSQCKELRELEINGRANGAYDPQVLLAFNSLTKISLIMPSANVVDVLPAWIEKTGENLTSFHVLCKSSNLITDSTLGRIAPFMKRLKHFHIAGCPKVTQKGILAVLANVASAIKSLGLEGLSATFDLESLTRNLSPLTSLTSLTLTLPSISTNDSRHLEFLTLTEYSPLAEIHLYVTAGSPMSKSQFLLTPECIASFLAHHATQLRKFSVHRMKIQPQALRTLCASCSRLESLFVMADDVSLDAVVRALALSRSLRNIHVNLSQTVNGGYLSPSEVLQIARQLGPRVRQLGFSNRVYQIDRVARFNATGETVIEMELAPYEHPEVPEQFLIVRT